MPCPPTYPRSRGHQSVLGSLESPVSSGTHGAAGLVRDGSRRAQRFWEGEAKGPKTIMVPLCSHSFHRCPVPSCQQEPCCSGLPLDQPIPGAGTTGPRGL